MRVISLFVTLVCIIVTFISCHFNQSVNTDLATGAFSRGDGLSCDDVTMEINGTIENRNKFIFGERVNLIFNDIKGLSKSDSKTYPKLSIQIIKDEKDTILSNFNLLKSVENGTNLSPLRLEANFTTSLPYKNNESYEVHIQISDKKGDGTFTYELPFTVTQNDLLTIKNNGLSYSNIYLWNDTLKEPVFDNNVSFKHDLILILENLEGLESRDGKVFPIFSIDLTDADGNRIISSPNILSQYETQGVSAEDIKKQLTATLTFTKGKVSNPCHLSAILKDSKTSREIIITTNININ